MSDDRLPLIVRSRRGEGAVELRDGAVGTQPVCGCLLTLVPVGRCGYEFSVCAGEGGTASLRVAEERAGGEDCEPGGSQEFGWRSGAGEDVGELARERGSFPGSAV